MVAATKRPSAASTPIASPSPIRKRQSASVWFQPASAESGTQEGASSGRRRRALSPATGSSELAVADIEMRRLVEARAAARDPVGGPVDEPGERHRRIAEEAPRLARVDEPACRR